MIARIGNIGVVTLTLMLAACGSDADLTSTTSTTSATSTPDSIETAASSEASDLPSTAATAFPIAAFAALSEDPVPNDVAVRLQEVLAETAGAKGITATVITPEGMWSGAVGKTDGIDDLSVDSQFGIGSGTKSITAAQVMQLVEAGEVSLDAPAADYLPADLGFDTNEATIRQLLGHNSGIPDWYGVGMEEHFERERDRVWDLDDVLALVDTARDALGTHEYADTNYNLLGLVIENVRQRPLVEVLREGVLRVEGAERLIYQPDEAPTEPIAMPNGESRDALELGGGYLPSISDASASGAAGGMASDSISLARWWRAFCAGELVSEATLTEMSTFSDGPDPYGLGLFNPASAVGHGVGHLGANFGYISSAGCLTDANVVYAVLTNSRNSYGPDLATPLLQAVLAD